MSAIFVRTGRLAMKLSNLSPWSRRILLPPLSISYSSRKSTPMRWEMISAGPSWLPRIHTTSAMPATFLMWDRTFQWDFLSFLKSQSSNRSPLMMSLRVRSSPVSIDFSSSARGLARQTALPR